MNAKHSQASLDQSLAPPPTIIALDVWGPAPPDVHRYLIDADVFSSRNKLIVMDLLSLINLSEKVQIHDLLVYTGWSCPVSKNGLATRNALSKRSVDAAIHELLEAGVIERRKFGKSFRYRVKAIYQPQIDELKRNPDHPKHNFASPVPNPTRKSEIEEEALADSAAAAPSSNQSIPKGASAAPDPSIDSATIAPYQDLREEEKNPGPHPGSRVRTGIADPMPKAGEGEGNFSNSPKPSPDPPASTAAPVLPTGFPADDRLEEKASQREKDVQFFHSSSLSLADKFAGDEIDYTPPDLRRKRADQFPRSADENVPFARFG